MELITVLEAEHHKDSVTRYVPISDERKTTLPHIWAYLTREYKLRSQLDLPDEIRMTNYRTMGVKLEIVSKENVHIYQVVIKDGVPSLGEEFDWAYHENDFDEDSSNNITTPQLVILLYGDDVERFGGFVEGASKLIPFGVRMYLDMDVYNRLTYKK